MKTLVQHHKLRVYRGDTHHIRALRIGAHKDNCQTTFNPVHILYSFQTRLILFIADRQSTSE